MVSTAALLVTVRFPAPSADVSDVSVVPRAARPPTAATAPPAPESQAPPSRPAEVAAAEAPAAEAPATPAPATTSTLPTLTRSRLTDPAGVTSSGTVPPPTFLLVTPEEAYDTAPLRSVQLVGQFQFAYQQFGQQVLAFSPLPGTLTTWRLFTVMLYDRDAPAEAGGTQLDALLSDLTEGVTATVQVPVLRDPGEEERFVTFATEATGLAEDEARDKYERMLLSNREPLLGVGVGSYFVTSVDRVDIHPAA